MVADHDRKPARDQHQVHGYLADHLPRHAVHLPLPFSCLCSSLACTFLFLIVCKSWYDDGMGFA
jgi:hypothetical protein